MDRRGCQASAPRPGLGNGLPGCTCTLRPQEKTVPLPDGALLGRPPASGSGTKTSLQPKAGGGSPRAGGGAEPLHWSPSSPSPTNPVPILLQLIKEKLLDLLGKEEDEGSHDENVVRTALVP